MTYLYTTTDALEAEELIEGTRPGQKAKHLYHDIGIHHGENLVRRVGFNPMCSVEMNGNASTKELDSIVARLLKEGLYVAVEKNGMQRYTPRDIESRRRWVTLAMQQRDCIGLRNEPTFCLLIYSNNPRLATELHLSRVLSKK